jgi:hypothetical protein
MITRDVTESWQMPDPANLEVYQGDDYAATVMVTDSAGNAVNLTGYAIQSQVRAGPADNNPTIVCDVTCTFTAPNQITLSIPHATTTTLAGNYQWDLQLTSATGIVTTILAGGVAVTQEITRGPGLVVLTHPGRRPQNIFRAVRIPVRRYIA